MFRNLTPIVRTLLLINVGVYALEYLLGDVLFMPFALWPWGAEQYYGAFPFEPWQLLSYGFLHGSLMHLFFNMFALFSFGPEVERLFGARRFTIYYLLCVIGAALTQLAVLQLLRQAPTPTVGASGGIFGLLLAFALAYPHRKIIWIFLPVPIPAWLAVVIFGAAELYMGVFNTNQGVAHFAHLGGMAAGYLLIRYWRAVAANRR